MLAAPLAAVLDRENTLMLAIPVQQPLDEDAMRTIAQQSAQLPDLLAIARQYMKSPEVEQVDRALHLAQEVCRGISAHPDASLQVLRPIPPLEHALAVATVLANMHIDAIGIAAGLIFEALDAELLTIERIETTLGTPVARIVESMLSLNILERQKRSAASLSDDAQNTLSNRTATADTPSQKKRRNRETLQRQQAETMRKMFFAMAEDPRVVLLKLAYRLHAMRTVCSLAAMASLTQEDRQETLILAQESRDIYAPLAGRLGISLVQSELEDLAFAVLEPDKYAWVRSQVEAESQQWNSYVEQVCTILHQEMAAIGLKAQVSGRVKHLYSFYKKLQRTSGSSGFQHLDDLKAADFSQIHDLIAFRILVESTNDCYLALGHIHSLWRPSEGRIKDFIANPKSNGYSALHTTVFCLDNQLVEIQIRTFAMHEMAEYGVAIHWHYKDVGDHASASAKELLTWLRRLADWQHDLRLSATSDSEFIEAVKGDIFQEQIFVFTPKGEVKDLPVGSTPLDFAYRVHSKIGDKCAGARVISNGDRITTRMVPLDYELKSGEIVDILTSRTAHPTRDWLTFTKTAAARSRIRRYLKFHERDINIQIGRERLDRELRTVGLRGIEVLTEDFQDWLINEYHLATFDDLLAAIGSDEIRQHAVAVKVNDRWQQLHQQHDSKEQEEPLPLPLIPTTTKPIASAHLEVAGVSGLLTSLANCCFPLPGDEIVGFISRGKGAIVHRADCRNIARYRDRDRERLINVNWTSMAQQRYLAPILITARDRAGLIRDIAAAVAESGINMTAVSSNVNGRKEHVSINATLEIESLVQMEWLFTRLEHVKNVIHVERDVGKKKSR